MICFPRDYERLAAQLKIEAPVLVRGMLTGDEDSAPKISVSQIMALEEVQVKLPAGMRIRINLDRATEELLADLKSAADAAPGPGKVMIFLEKKGGISGHPRTGANERGCGPRLGGAHRRIDWEGNCAAAGISPLNEWGFLEYGPAGYRRAASQERVVGKDYDRIPPNPYDTKVLLFPAEISDVFGSVRLGRR